MQNKDYSGMVPGTPQASPSMAEPAAGGVSPTQSVAQADQVKEQLVAALEEKGVFNQATDDAQMQEIMQLVDQLTQAVLAGDQQAIMQNPLMQLLGINPEEIESGVKVGKKAAAKGMQKAARGMPGPGGM